MHTARKLPSPKHYRLNRWYHHLGFIAIVLGMAFKALLPAGFMPSANAEQPLAFTLCQPSLLLTGNASPVIDDAAKLLSDQSAEGSASQEQGHCVYSLLGFTALLAVTPTANTSPLPLQRALISTPRALALPAYHRAAPQSRAPPAA